MNSQRTQATPKGINGRIVVVALFLMIAAIGLGLWFVLKANVPSKQKEMRAPHSNPK